MFKIGGHELLVLVRKHGGMLRENMLNNNIGDVNRFHLNFPGD
jgi:hypothetical protein